MTICWANWGDNMENYFITLQAKYDISIEYCRKEDSARMIHDILYYHAREYLKNVE